MSDGDVTPLMRQYRDVKAAHHDAIVFFRVGDFYEMFYEDAKIASRILNIALTSRDKTRPDPVPLCGVPHHAATAYIAKLLKAGRTVALCDQVEDPKLAKGLVRREVVRVYTPGTLIDAELLPPTESVFLSALEVDGPDGGTQRAGLAALDSSTGEFWVMEFHGLNVTIPLSDEIARLDPRELLYPPTLPSSVTTWLATVKGPRQAAVDRLDTARAVRLLQEHFRVASLDGFGCYGLTAAVRAAASILRYVRDTQPATDLGHISRLRVRHRGESMHLDAATIRNLELVKPLVEDRRDATLVSVLDRTVSAMGSRLLREWILRPLVEPGAITARLDAVEELHRSFAARSAIRRALGHVQDIARLASRLSMRVATPRDLLAVKDSLVVLPEIHARLADSQASLLKDLIASWDSLSDVAGLIDTTILPDAPASVREGGIIRDGYHNELDELRKIGREGKNWIAALEAEERRRTGIETLKIRFNQVFGYYIEVSKTNATKVPDRYVRKQTLANAERFTTPELKELEDRVLGADAKQLVLEQELFECLRARLAEATGRLQAMAQAVALLDVITALAEVAALNQYVRPHVDGGDTIEIIDGRHPVVERLTPAGGFIPNDATLDLRSHRLVILTGPNMAGKSTYLRQIALIVLLAQMGSFVPAKRAVIGVADRIFTRVGANDNLAAGQSTFMVEMAETAQILTNATRRSLILLDEIGRGTSTYDGLSIAWAVAEHILDPLRLGARTLFATHYHEMTELGRLHEGARNFSVLVKERDQEIIFLRKIVEGGADRSYGIHVARLAGLPGDVIQRATEVLDRLESTNASASHSSDAPSMIDQTLPTPHPIVEEVRQMDLFSMTPLEALNRLADLQRRLDQPAAR